MKKCFPVLHWGPRPSAKSEGRPLDLFRFSAIFAHESQAARVTVLGYREETVCPTLLPELARGYFPMPSQMRARPQQRLPDS